MSTHMYGVWAVIWDHRWYMQQIKWKKYELGKKKKKKKLCLFFFFFL